MAEENADHWLKLAREARARAAGLSDPYSKRTVLLIAQRYETLAERARYTAEHRAKSKSA